MELGARLPWRVSDGGWEGGAFVCASERGKHKSRSRAITAARLETRECDECVLSIAISPLFSAHFVVLPLLTPRLAVCLSKRRWWWWGGAGRDGLPAVMVSLSCHGASLLYVLLSPMEPTTNPPYPHPHRPSSTPYFLFFFFLHLSPRPSLSGERVAWRCPLPGHHPTVNE